jgi:hypothetical protein
MKQTAVDFFWNKIALKLSVEQIVEFLVVFEQAKQMEKEQIRDAWTDGCIGELYELNAYFSSGKYYNETYNKES